MQRLSERQLTLVICIALALLTCLAYSSILQCEFVDYDDDTYVRKNEHVKHGLTRDSFVWAFTNAHEVMWHPLTSLSHMLDCQLFGLNPSRHHLTSLLIHLASILALFVVLNGMTGAVWRSAFVAALFALHPLNVESVAWIAERKNVLCGFFWIITIGAYVRYARKPGVIRAATVGVSFCLGLMSKPMVITLPFVLLLLDYWPLQRYRPPSDGTTRYKSASGFRLIAEKIPLFLLSALISIVTFLTQESGGAAKGTDLFPLADRISNGLISYVSYLGKIFFPNRLAVYYPHRAYGSIPTWLPVTALLLLASVTVIVFYLMRSRRYPAVGWLWFVGTLVPVIGVIQVGSQSMADRYAYLPALGIFVLVAWGAAELIAGRKRRQITAGVIAATVLLLLLLTTRTQVGYWKNNLSLFGHCLAVTENNAIMHNSYGLALLKARQPRRAIVEFEKAYEVNPNYGEAFVNRGRTLGELGKLDEAVADLTVAVRLLPTANTYNNLGSAFLLLGDLDQAITQFERSLELQPLQLDVLKKMNDLYVATDKIEEAVDCCDSILRVEPDNVAVLNRLAWLKAVRVKMTFFNPREAIQLAKRACDLTSYKEPSVLDTLAVAFAADGNFPDAVETIRKALVILNAGGLDAAASDFQERLELFESGQSYKEE